MDLLTDVLNTFHLRTAFMHRGQMKAPWGIRFTASPTWSGAAFHVVTEGRCVLETLDSTEPPLYLEAGDFVLLPHGQGHNMRDSEGTPVYSLEFLLANGAEDETGTLRCGGDGVQTTLICGEFHLENSATIPLLSALPPILLIRGSAGRSMDWLEGTLEFLASEACHNRPGSRTVITRLVDILFIQAIRTHLANQPECEKGWLRVMSDAELGPILNAIHTNPAHPWTVAELAHRVCLSRSAFAARFTELMGEPPLHYVTRWRIHQAAILLQKGQSLGEVATATGYQSEAAFSKVFRRWTGEAPGRYRTSRAIGR